MWPLVCLSACIFLNLLIFISMTIKYFCLNLSFYFVCRVYTINNLFIYHQKGTQYISENAYMWFWTFYLIHHLYSPFPHFPSSIPPSQLSTVYQTVCPPSSLITPTPECGNCCLMLSLYVIMHIHTYIQPYTPCTPTQTHIHHHTCTSHTQTQTQNTHTQHTNAYHENLRVT